VANGREYRKGTWVVLMDQPFAPLVKELFEPQHYPDLRETPNGPPILPYDVGRLDTANADGSRIGRRSSADECGSAFRFATNWSKWSPCQAVSRALVRRM